MSRPFKYTFIVVLVALATGLAAVGGWRYARASAPVNGPIVLISVDTLRADRLPAYGYQKVKTPAIDALASDGVVFERAYSHASQTLPAHASLLSGRLPFETGVRDNVGFTVKSSERLLAEMLRDRGYATGGVVSSYVLRRETGIDQGFTFFDGNLPQTLPDATDALQRDGAESVAVAERWLESAGTTRAFLFVHLYEPHAPHAPPARFAAYAPYDGEIAYTDELVGRLIRYLKAHQLYDQSTIILVADHGEGLGDHGEQQHGLFVYEEAVHVPLIIKPAAGEGAGRRVTDVVQHIDLVPTILDLAKAPIPGNLRGRSLKPLLDGTGGLGERQVYAESLYARYHFGWSGLTSLTDGRYHYIRAPREELYDLRTDPAERLNIAAVRPREAAALRASLDELASSRRVDRPSDVSPDDRRRLESLGYVGTSGDLAPEDPALADPKDTYEIVEIYREALDLAVARHWRRAIERFQVLLRAEPEMADVWAQLAAVAVRAERSQLAIAAFKQVIALRPDRPEGHLGAAAALLGVRRLEEARDHATQAAAAAESDVSLRASAYELLATIALARQDAPSAREQAELARQARPTVPMPLYIEARLLYDRGRHAEALPLFEKALADLEEAGGPPMPQWRFYLADTLVRLNRDAEAESQFLEELESFPLNTRARAGLANVYQATGRAEQAGQALADLVRTRPTPDTYALAARLWTAFGDARKASAVRAEARRLFASSPRPAAAAAVR